MKRVISDLIRLFGSLLRTSKRSLSRESSVWRLQYQSQFLSHVVLVCSLSLLVIGVIIRVKMTLPIAFASLLCLAPSFNLFASGFHRDSRFTRAIDQFFWICANLGVFGLSIGIGNLSNIHFVFIGLIVLGYKISPPKYFLNPLILPSFLFLIATVVNFQNYLGVLPLNLSQVQGLNFLSALISLVMVTGGFFSITGNYSFSPDQARN